ncbi:dihydrofolate reductase [Catenulispora sp. MAP12-49]|uniref:dihydrofolate reductase family protein n=1 Tax=unclassified Catenulispora TaxID=414885 RepID=UPI003519656C
MGKIIVSTNASLDGVVQDPEGKEGFALGGWFELAIRDDRAAWAAEFEKEATAAEALLLGRTSDEWFASRWLGRTGTWADKLNTMPKYVVSGTLEHTAWSNGTVVTGDLPAEVARLKREIDGEILVYASFQLVHALIEHDLVDEVRIMVMPVAVGDGVRLFGPSGTIKPLRLIGTRTVGEGILFVAYEVVREA